MIEALAGTQVVGAAAGSDPGSSRTAVWTDDTFGSGFNERLGHGGQQNELVPRLVEALAGKTVIGAAVGENHTSVWTDAGELFTFG